MQAHEGLKSAQTEQVQHDLQEVRDRISRWREVVERDDRHREMGLDKLQNLQLEVNRLLKLLETNVPVIAADDPPRLQDIQNAWRALVTSGATVSRNYIGQLIERIDVRENEISITPREPIAA